MALTYEQQQEQMKKLLEDLAYIRQLEQLKLQQIKALQQTLNGQWNS